MGIDPTQRLHWTQRIALVRHNLHAARRTNDYTFFKTLQAHALIDGTDHVAILNSMLGGDADQILSTLDNLNAGIAYVHQDAFKAVYDGAKSTMYKADNSPSSRKSLLRVDICQQRDMADHAIDKTANSATNLIQTQPVHCQDAVANAWITGATIIADAVCVCLNQMDQIEDNMDDFIRLEYSWSNIQNSVDASISALRGIFSLMASTTGPSLSPTLPRSLSVSSATGSDGVPSTRSRNSSTASALGLIKRAFSHSHGQMPPPLKSGRTEPLSLPDSSKGFRLSMSAACPTRMSNYADHSHTLLNTIPATPSANDTPTRDTMSPFKDKGDYFAFDMEKESENASKKTSSADDLMQLESLDPLYSPTVDELVKMPGPLALRTLSESFVASPLAPIHV
ncbi:hypothetical protein BS50DRAFT_604079 [Corynespora cassiicola Philippines]|uniref:Uncharacterized protein n=1 Tax=Corynespora cassiicola Philippines TaxID=1448308 RepID=A0A2T2N7U5_CORCC|nr:hypothetical protein BS50DRAFT_604079 [Corynespora cassiicola Philippines]